MIDVLKAEKAFVKAFTKKVGSGKTALTVIIPMTPKLAKDFGFHSAVYQQDGTPKQEILEAKLEVAQAEALDFRLDVPTIAETLVIPSISDACEFVAKRKGATKKGKTSRLVLEFKIKFSGSSIGVFEWLEKYGQAAGTLALKRTGPEQINLSDPASRRKPRAGKDAAAGDDAEPEQTPEAPAPAAGATTGSDAQTVASVAQMRMKGTVQ